MIRQVRVENFREQIAPNNKLSGKNSTEGGIFLPRSSSSDSLRIVYQAEKTHSFFPSSPLPIHYQSSPKGVTQLRNYKNNTIQILDKNEQHTSSSSFTGSPNSSPSNYSPQPPSSLIICNSSNSSYSKQNTLIPNNITQQNQQFSNHGIRTLQCPSSGYGSQRQILVQVVQPSVSLLNFPTAQQKQLKISENTISQTQQKQLSNHQQISKIRQQKQHQTHQEQLKVNRKEISNNFLRVVSSSSSSPSNENEMQQQSDRFIVKSAEVNDLSNEIQRLLGVNEKLTQETHSWRQKYEQSEIRRQILEQEQTQIMKETPSTKELDSSRQVSEFSAIQTISSNIPLQTKQIKESLRVRSPSCGSLEDSKSQNSIQEKQRNFQEIVQQLSSLENLKKTTDQSDVQNLIFALQEENALLKQRLLLRGNLDNDKQEREKAEQERQQLEIQRLETACKKLKQQLEISCKSENSKEQIIRDLEKDKEILQGRLNLCMQDLQKGLSQQNNAGSIISYFDKADIFYHSTHSQEAKNGLIRGKKTSEIVPTAAVSGNTLKFEKSQLEKVTKTSNTSCTSKNFQEYRYNSSRNTNNSPSSQSSSNAPSIEHSQANDILEKTSNLTRVIHPLILHPSSSVKTIEYTSHASSQQSSQYQQQKYYQQQPWEGKHSFEIMQQDLNEYHSQFSFDPEQLQIINQNGSKEVRKEQINQSNSQRGYIHSQQNNQNKTTKDNQFIDNNNSKQLQGQQGHSQRFQQKKDQGNNHFHPINQVEATLVGKYPSFFEEKENQSISKRELFCGNYSFSQKENCTSEINQN